MSNNPLPFQPLYEDAMRQIRELKIFIAENCFGWIPYKNRCGQEIYAPSETIALTAKVGEDIWKFFDKEMEQIMLLDKPIDVWIPWKGGNCPVPPETLIRAEVNNNLGGITYINDRADRLKWRHNIFEGSWNITAYKILPNQEKKQ